MDTWTNTLVLTHARISLRDGIPELRCLASSQVESEEQIRQLEARGRFLKRWFFPVVFSLHCLAQGLGGLQITRHTIYNHNHKQTIIMIIIMVISIITTITILISITIIIIIIVIVIIIVIIIIIICYYYCHYHYYIF